MLVIKVKQNNYGLLQFSSHDTFAVCFNLNTECVAILLGYKTPLPLNTVLV